MKFLMKPAFSEEWLNVLLAVLLSGIYIGLFVWYGFRGWKADGDGFFKIRFFYALAGCMVLCGLTGFGFIASILVRPVFVYRYMLPAMGCFWFCPVLCLDGLFTAYPPKEKVVPGGALFQHNSYRRNRTQKLPRFSWRGGVQGGADAGNGTGNFRYCAGRHYPV